MPRRGVEGRGETVYLVSCVKAKRATRAPAKDLYISPWFRKARQYVERTGRRWFILSARHGVLEPEAMIRPYEQALEDMPRAERRAWADKVLGQLAQHLGEGDTLVILAGRLYRTFVESELRDRAVEVQVPLAGMRIGEQMSWFDRQRPQQPEVGGEPVDDLLT